MELSSTNAGPGFKRGLRLVVSIVVILLVLSFFQSLKGSQKNSEGDEFIPKTGARWHYKDPDNPIPARRDARFNLTMDDGAIVITIDLFKEIERDGQKSNVKVGESIWVLNHSDDTRSWSGKMFRQKTDGGYGSVVFSDQTHGVLNDPDGSKYAIDWR